MGLLADEKEALMWRGLILNRAVQHFLQDVDWGDDLAYLLLDMPPGTGDVQMGVAKLIPRTEVRRRDDARRSPHRPSPPVPCRWRGRTT